MDTRSIRVYSYNGMEWPVTNFEWFAMFDGDCVVYDDVVSYSFLYYERNDFYHH
jgi:hypothetical protein